MIQSVRSKRKRKDSDDEGEAAEVSQTQISTNFASSYLFNTPNISTALYFSLLSFACENSYVTLLRVVHFDV